ncbi:hypothetical protein TARUN_6900 [Trichoderma arundinaceum]|uniref:Uncharacterized protein n=1 Tax=Trichoderma arundinaceum TaxID=490622 RepID=A0A395NHE1_TRIAR|nr:hypothetical protein TARUN_6900 [Trichoderma arundinaceum]
MTEYEWEETKTEPGPNLWSARSPAVTIFNDLSDLLKSKDLNDLEVRRKLNVAVASLKHCFHGMEKKYHDWAAIEAMNKLDSSLERVKTDMKKEMQSSEYNIKREFLVVANDLMTKNHAKRTHEEAFGEKEEWKTAKADKGVQTDESLGKAGEGNPPDEQPGALQKATDKVRSSFFGGKKNWWAQGLEQTGRTDERNGGSYWDGRMDLMMGWEF